MPTLSSSPFIRDDESKRDFFTKPSDLQKKRQESAKSAIFTEPTQSPSTDSRRESTMAEAEGKLVLTNDQDETITQYVIYNIHEESWR